MNPTLNSLPPFEPISPELGELYRQATPEAKLAVVARLNAGLQALKAAELVAREPHLSSIQRQARVRHWWLTARD